MTKFNIKKYLCIIVSIVLLISNTQIFSQEENEIVNIISEQEIEEISRLAKNITGRYNKTIKNITGTADYIDYHLSGQSNLNFKNPYILETQIKKSYKMYYNELYELEEYLQLFQNKMRETYTKYLNSLPEDTYLKKVTENYINSRMNTLFNTQNHHLDNLLSIGDIIAGYPEIEDISPYIKSLSFANGRYKYLKNRYMEDSSFRNSLIRDLANNQNYYQKVFCEDTEKLIKQLQRVKDSFSKETIEFFSKTNHTPEEVLTYFEARLPENQKAVLFALRVSDEGATIKQIIPHIRYYLKQTNRRLWKLDKFSADKLTVSLSKMPLERRINFIDNLLDFTPETKLLRNEIHQAEKTVGKKIVNRNSIKLSGTFIAIGAFLVASTITEVTTDNNFNRSIGPVQLAQIRHKIDNGQILSLQEISDYYTDERNLKEIIENPMGLFEAFEIAITINDYLDELNVEKSPFNPTAQEKKVKKAIDKYLNKVDWENATSQIGII